MSDFRRVAVFVGVYCEYIGIMKIGNCYVYYNRGYIKGLCRDTGKWVLGLGAAV